MDNVRQHVSNRLQWNNKNILQSSKVSIVTAAVFGLLTLGSNFGLHPQQAHAASIACSGDSYTVVSGDTLSGIASKHNADWHILAELNHIENPDLIFPDQTICFTNSSGASSAPTQKAPVQIAPKAHVQAPVKQATPQAPVQAPVKSAPVQTVPQAPVQAPTQPPVTTQPQSTSISGMINEIFGSYASTATRIATCESGMNPNATNSYAIGGSHAAGLFQILYPSTWYSTSQAGASPYNARANIIAAHEIFVRDGYSFREWTCQ